MKKPVYEVPIRLGDMTINVLTLNTISQWDGYAFESVDPIGYIEIEEN